MHLLPWAALRVYDNVEKNDSSELESGKLRGEHCDLQVTRVSHLSRDLKRHRARTGRYVKRRVRVAQVGGAAGCAIRQYSSPDTVVHALRARFSQSLTAGKNWLFNRPTAASSGWKKGSLTARLWAVLPSEFHWQVNVGLMDTRHRSTGAATWSYVSKMWPSNHKRSSTLVTRKEQRTSCTQINAADF
jgi:hypothetical protein